LFSTLDCYDNGFLTQQDIEQFLRSHGIHASNRELFELCSVFEKTSDGRISHHKFARRLVGHESERFYGSRAISRELEHLLVKYFEIEITSLRNLELMRYKVADRYDFSLLNGFQSIDRNKFGHIKREQVCQFMAKHGLLLSSVEVEAIFKRFDRDLDGLLSYTEFVELVLPYSPTQIPS
jgi:Ca2+-binding EF-hand superfamily protein